MRIRCGIARFAGGHAEPPHSIAEICPNWDNAFQIFPCKFDLNVIHAFF
jgi:hypothetical protein